MTLLRWTDRAVADLEESGDFIARAKPAAARVWVGRLQDRARAAATAPRAGRVVPELGRDDIREVILRSYRIVYRVDPGGIVVLTIFEGHRTLAGVAADDDNGSRG